MNNNDDPYVRAFRVCVCISALIHARREQPEAVGWLEERVAAARESCQP